MVMVMVMVGYAIFNTSLARNLPVENSKCDVMTIDQQEAGDI